MTQLGTERELFEGDYEHFEARNAAHHQTNQVRGNGHSSHHGEKRDVTRLPDGRVLKGSPHKQRREAEFWAEIAHNSDELVQQVESSTTVEAVADHTADIPIASPANGKTKIRQSTPKQRSTGPKPSQRGYKWPTPEE